MPFVPVTAQIIFGELGKNNLDSSVKIESNNYVQKKFTNQIASLMQNCDLVISRSGAGTINELIQTGKPSILIPYPNSKNDHQEIWTKYLGTIDYFTIPDTHTHPKMGINFVG